MAKKKGKRWIVEFWDDNLDKLVRHGRDSYEEAQMLAAKTMKRLGRSARIILRGTE